MWYLICTCVWCKPASANQRRAQASLAKIKELNDGKNSSYHEAVAHIYLGDVAAALRKFEDDCAAQGNPPELQIELARAYGIAASLKTSQPELVAEYASKCIAIIRKAIADGYRSFFWLQRSEDLDSVRDRKEFRDLLRQVLGDFRFSSVRRVTEDFDVAFLPIQGTSDIRAEAVRLAALEYRPLVHSAVLPDVGDQTLGIGLWIRPKISASASRRSMRRRANAAIALLRLGDTDTWKVLEGQDDPGLATAIIHAAEPCGMAFSQIAKRLEGEREDRIRQSLILLMGQYKAELADAEVTRSIQQSYVSSPSPGVHSASEWTLRAWGMHDLLEATREQLKQMPSRRESRWRVDLSGLTMIRLELPTLPGQPSHRFEISAHEITRSQMQPLLEQSGPMDDLNLRVAPELDCPQISVTWYDAARFCRWLSEQSDFSSEQMCYPELWRIKDGVEIRGDFQQRTGYRLPTEKEWEFACRAASITSRFYGDDELYSTYYGWSQTNSRTRTWPVGSLKPNPWGLFDVYGNVWEWCHDRQDLPWIDAALGVQSERVTDASYRMMRGGSFYLPGFHLQTSMRIANRPSFLSEDYGFRVARTLADHE